jgi:pimeloyl-ACP methyl ester carboxylesterase
MLMISANSFSVNYSDPHSTKQIEDNLRWSAATDAQTLIDSTAAELAARVRCPVHVVHGTDDRVRRWKVGEELARLTGGSLTLVEGSGHGLLDASRSRSTQ